LNPRAGFYLGKRAVPKPTKKEVRAAKGPAVLYAEGEILSSTSEPYLLYALFFLIFQDILV